MRGHRLIALGWLLTLGLSLAAIAFAGEVAGRFGGGRVLIRPWMQAYNLALGSLQLSALVLLAAGALRLPQGPAKKMAAAAFVVAASAVTATLLFPSLLGPGPWAPDALEVGALRSLIFAPSALRAIGCAAVTVAIFGSRSFAVVALLAVDFFLVARSWLATPKAVMLCLHPYCVAPLGLMPWVLASLLFFWLLLNPAATRT